MNPLVALAMAMAQHSRQQLAAAPGPTPGRQGARALVGAMRETRVRGSMSHPNSQVVTRPRLVRSIHGTPAGKHADARINRGLA